MAFLKREHVEMLLGIGVLALGLGLLLFTFSQALTIATDPGDFFRSQFETESVPRGPSASFTWDTNGLAGSFQDTSQAGDAAITSWAWNFGDGNRTSGPDPSPGHTYANASIYQVSLIIRDANGKESRAIAQVEAAPTQVRSGDSMGDPTAGLELNFDFGGLLQPMAFTFLTFGMYVVLAMVGGHVTKAGWNMIKPKPETIRVRLKPRHLTQAIEQDAGSSMLMYPPPPAR